MRRRQDFWGISVGEEEEGFGGRVGPLFVVILTDSVASVGKDSHVPQVVSARGRNQIFVLDSVHTCIFVVRTRCY